MGLFDPRNWLLFAGAWIIFLAPFYIVYLIFKWKDNVMEKYLKLLESKCCNCLYCDQYHLTFNQYTFIDKGKDTKLYCNCIGDFVKPVYASICDIEEQGRW